MAGPAPLFEVDWQLSDDVLLPCSATSGGGHMEAEGGENEGQELPTVRIAFRPVATERSRAQTAGTARPAA
jgi:hypothetical protein